MSVRLRVGGYGAREQQNRKHQIHDEFSEPSQPRQRENHKDYQDQHGQEKRQTLVQQADARENSIRLRRRINFKFWWIQFSGSAFRQSRYFRCVWVSMSWMQGDGSVCDYLIRFSEFDIVHCSH